MVAKEIVVLHILNSLNTGGIETWLVNLLRFYHAEKTANIRFVFLLSSTEKGFYDDEVTSMGGKIIYCSNSKNPLVLYRRVTRAVKEEGVDVIHSHVYAFSSVYALLSRFLKVEFIAHSHTNRSFTTFIKRTYHKVSSVLINRFSDVKLACSELAGKALFRDGEFEVLSYGVDANKFKPGLGIPEDLGGIAEELSGSLIVGHVGRFVDVKNHQFILEVAECLKESKRPISFVFVGEGPEKKRIADLIEKKQLSNIFFLEPRSDINRLMDSVFDVFILPSKFEGLGIVVLEAQSVGVPTVISDKVPSEVVLFPDLVKIASIEQAADWAEEISKIDKYEYSAKKAFNDRFSNSRYSLSIAAGQLLEVYNRKAVEG